MCHSRLIVLVVLALVPAPRDAVAQTSSISASADARIAELLRTSARTGTLRDLRWPRFPNYRDELASLYGTNGWRLMWSDGGRPTPAARAAIDVLAGSRDRALNPEDYDVPALDRQVRQLGTSGRATESELAWFDVALSVGLFRYRSDLHIGRVNPTTLSIGINIESKKLDLARAVHDAVAAGRIAQLVPDAEPRLVQYRNLLVAHRRYRALADSVLPAISPAGKAVKVGEPLVQAPALRRRLVAFGDLASTSPVNSADSATYDAVTAAAVARFQERHGLAADSVLGRATRIAIGVSPARRARQLELALERVRWLPPLDDGPFAVVNVPSFQLYAFDTVGGTGAPALQMDVVVGQAGAGRATPLFEDRMEYIIFRPYWVIPPGILRNETLPATRRDPGYLSRNDMEVYLGDGNTGPAQPANAASLRRVAAGTLGIRQKPGPRNSLGLAKFIFPNDHNVYLHGTPATELFSRARRDFSHGCIRLENPAAFAEWVLRDPTRWSRSQVEAAMNGRASRRVDLARPMPVVIYYTTAVVRPDGVVAFYDDVYGHDARLERALAKGYPYAP
jgi:murein L,D-transpeptidase YcbB/YkuD